MYVNIRAALVTCVTITLMCCAKQAFTGRQLVQTIYICRYVTSLTCHYTSTGRQPVRVYMDGCFDVMHYGHANALRQARALGDQLVLGLISDDEIRRAKGPPVMNYKERKTLVGANKWVDEVINGES